jgi:hypothetical protein
MTARLNARIEAVIVIDEANGVFEVETTLPLLWLSADPVQYVVASRQVNTSVACAMTRVDATHYRFTFNEGGPPLLVWWGSWIAFATETGGLMLPEPFYTGF